MVAAPPAALATRAAQDLVGAVGRLRRRIREVATDEQLSSPQTSVLALLGKNGAATASALAAAEGVRPQSMSTTLAALEQHGLVQRHADPHDGRRQLVTLTREGSAVFHGNRTARHEWLATTIRQRLTAEEAQLIVDAAALLDRVTAP